MTVYDKNGCECVGTRVSRKHACMNAACKMHVCNRVWCVFTQKAAYVLVVEGHVVDPGHRVYGDVVKLVQEILGGRRILQ